MSRTSSGWHSASPQGLPVGDPTVTFPTCNPTQPDATECYHRTALQNEPTGQSVTPSSTPSRLPSRPSRHRGVPLCQISKQTHRALPKRAKLCQSAPNYAKAPITTAGRRKTNPPTLRLLPFPFAFCLLNPTALPTDTTLIPRTGSMGAQRPLSAVSGVRPARGSRRLRQKGFRP